MPKSLFRKPASLPVGEGENKKAANRQNIGKTKSVQS